MKIPRSLAGAPAAAAGTLHFAEIAVRAGAAATQFGQQFALEVRGDGVLQTLGFVVDLVPLHAEDFREHALDQMVAKTELAGDFAAIRGQAYVSVAAHAHEAVFFQAAHGHSDCGGRD